jgi:hypothetical protein
MLTARIRRLASLSLVGLTEDPTAIELLCKLLLSARNEHIKESFFCLLGEMTQERLAGFSIQEVCGFRRS